MPLQRGGVILRLSYKQCAAGGIEMDSEPGCHNVQSESRANLGFPGGSIGGDLPRDRHPPIKVTQDECIIA